MNNPRRSQGNSTTLDRPSSQNKTFANYSVPRTQMLVFIDPALKDVQRLVAGVQPEAEVILLDPHRDGVGQIAQTLTGRTTVSSVHLVAHGSSGRLQLGASELSLDNLDCYADQLQAWSNSLSGSSLLIYGCQVAAGQRGADFLQRLHQLTGANIAASTEKVGSQKQGGHWQLGYQIGQVTDELAFLPHVREVYLGVFANYNEATDGDITGDRLAPDTLELEAGVNSLTATSAAGDREYITVTVPEGFQLDSLVLDSYVSSDETAFAGVQSGTTFTEPATGTNVSNLLGWDHFGPAQVGTDILDNIGNGRDAIGFTAPLPSGDYTFWLQQQGDLSTYTLEFNVSATDGGGGEEPVVSFTASPTTLIETEGTVLTFKFELSEPPPEGGITVNLAGSIPQAFTQLALQQAVLNGISGIADSSVNQDFSSFNITIVEQTGSIRVPIFNDGMEEGLQEITFTLEPGESYTVAADASASTVQFADDPIGGGEPLEDPIPEEIPRSSFGVELTPVATGLTAPNWGTAAPGIDDRLFVSDQEGILWSINLANGEKSVFLDVSDRLVDLGIGGPNSFDERGLLGVAFHPDFASNGLLYTFTSEPANEPADFSTMPEGEAPNHQNVITEWRVSDPLNPNATVAPDSDRVLMRIDQPQFNHNAGALNFGPDGYLYIALGDGGAGDDQGIGHSPQGNGQDASNVLGSLLRVNPLGSNSANGQYGIPDSNPFVNDSAIPDETFAFGLRNPFRFSFDRETGDLVLADVGQNDIEEVNIVEAGGNYGWGLKEGTFFFNPNGSEPGFVTNVDPGVPPGLIDPVLQYDHDEGISVIGGFVYRGDDIPTLDGKLIFGDYSRNFDNPQGSLFLGNLSTGQIEEVTPEDFPYFVLGFAEDANGEVYVLANETGVPFGDTGVIFKLEDEGDLPQVSFSASPTTLIEAEQTAVNLTFTLDKAPSEGGVTVFLDSETLNAIGEFDVSALEVTGGLSPEPNADASGFFFTITEQTATIILPVLDDDVAEDTENITFTLQAGEGYTIDPNTNSSTITIKEITTMPTVSFEVIPATISEETPNAQVVWQWTVTGDFPQEGVVINLDTLGANDVIKFTEQFAGNREVQFINAEIVGFDTEQTGVPGRLAILLSAPNASFVLPIANDVIEEGTQTFDFRLAEGEGYTVDPAKNATLLTITDDNGGPGVGPTVGVSVNKTALKEAGDEFTVTFTVDGEIPEGGVTVLVSSPSETAIADFDIAGINPATDITGTNGEPLEGNASSFLITLTEPTATITLSTFDDDIDEGVESLTFNLIDGEEYKVDPAASSVTLTIDDEVDITKRPTVSLQTIAGSFSPSDDILAPALVRSLEDGASLLTFIFNVEGEIPEGGLVVDVNSNINLTDYFTGLARPPFSPGGQILEAIYEPETREATGFKFRIDQPNAQVAFRLINDEEASGNVDATFTLEPREGYSNAPEANSSSVTLYDTLASVPTPTVVPEVSFSVSETNLVESAGTLTTVTFTLDKAPPPEGVLVYLAAPQQFLGDFNVFAAEVEGGVFPAPNFQSSGFFFKILKQEASITLPIFPDDVTEGLESVTLSLQEAPGYAIAPDSTPITVTLTDTPESEIQVSFTTEPSTLIESEATVSVHTFSLSAAPPEGGVTVFVSTSSLGDFNLEGVEVTGGTISEVTEAGFSFNITAQEATINLPVAADGVAEGLEEATFTLEAGEGYQVNPDASSGTFNIVDTAAQVPPPTEISEPNDIISLAVDSKLSQLYPTVSFSSSIDYDNTNRYPVEGVENAFLYIDATEDVDLYKVELKAGDTLRADIDALQIGSTLNSVLRVFDATGSQLAQNDNGSAPGEAFLSRNDSYLEFTAQTDGIYYIGVSSFPNGVDLIANNNPYEPTVPGSGTGRSRGTYTLNLSLNQEAIQEPTTPTPSTGTGPVISLETVTGTFDSNDNILAPALVQSLDTGASLLSLILSAEGEIPEGGVEVYISSDTVLGNYFTIANRPFTPGAEVVGAFYNEEGQASGIVVKLLQPNAVLSLRLLNNPEATGIAETTFTLEDAAGYVVDSEDSSSTVTLYDTLADVPTPTIVPEVSFSVSETNLVESAGTATTISFTLSEAPPPEGVLVYLAAPQQFLGDFNVFAAEVEGGVFPAPNFQSSGFFFKILEKEASITLPVFPDEVSEGIEGFTIALQAGPGYTIAPESEPISVTITDTPESQIQVSFSTEPEVLIESEATVSVHTFSLSAPPPEGGITISVSAPNLGEFNLDAIEVTGGTITATENGFDLTITAQTATINLPVLNDGVAEGLETTTFTLEAGENYIVNPDASSSTFTIVDTSDQQPLVETESNDTIATAIATNLSEDNPSFSIQGAINSTVATRNLVDASEDIDLYKVELKAGEKIAIDVDSVEYTITGSTVPQRLDSELRLFNAAGEQLASNFDGFAPDELFVANRDPYLEFTATEAGTYYVGVAQWQNRVYDPLTGENSSGRINPAAGRNTGEYTLEINLESDGGPNGDDPVVSLTATPEVVEEGSEVTFNFTVEGEIPAEGLLIKTDEFFNSQFDFNFEFEDPTKLSGIEFVDYEESETGEVTITWKLTQADAFIKVAAFDDNITEADEDFTLSLRPGDGYEVDPAADAATVTISDEAPPTEQYGPVSLSVDKTNLNEGDTFTITINVEGEIPEGGLEVNIASEVFGSLGEFAIFDAEDNFLPEYTGIAGDPQANEDASGFSAFVTENTATITLDVFDDGANEGVEELTFSVLDGENYDVDPEASEVTLTIDDGDEGQFFGGTEADEFDAGVSPEGFNGSNDLVFAGGSDDLIDTSAGNGNNRLYGQSGSDTFYLGSNDRAFGGTGDDLFFALGGGNVLTGGTGADKFWIASGEIPETSNTITDFNLADDVLGVGGLDLTFENLTITQQNGNTLIASGEQELAKLLGVSSSLSADNFVFA